MVLAIILIRPIVNVYTIAIAIILMTNGHISIALIHAAIVLCICLYITIADIIDSIIITIQLISVNLRESTTCLFVLP